MGTGPCRGQGGHCCWLPAVSSVRGKGWGGQGVEAAVAVSLVWGEGEGEWVGQDGRGTRTEEVWCEGADPQA